MFLSTSVFSPITSSSISLPSFLETSKTILFIFWKTFVSGIIRIDMMTSCNSVVILESCPDAFWKLESSNPGTLRSGFCNTTASAITSSPIRSISASIFSTFTLIMLCCLGWFFASVLPLPASLVLTT